MATIAYQVYQPSISILYAHGPLGLMAHMRCGANMPVNATLAILKSFITFYGYMCGPLQSDHVNNVV